MQEQGSLASSGIASPAKSESSDDMGFGHSPDSQVMQQQMDWLLLKLITSTHPTSPETASEAGTEANGNSIVCPRETQASSQSSCRANDDALGDNSADEVSISREAELDAACSTEAPSHGKQSEADDIHTLERRQAQLQSELDSSQKAVEQVESLQGELKSVQTQLEASQEAGAEAAGLQQEVLQLHSRLIASEQQAAQNQHLTQQVSQLQCDLQTAQEVRTALQQQLDSAKAEASSQGPAHHSRSSSRSDMELSVSRTESQQEMEQPSASMSIAEADLVEAASNAIQAQVSGSLCTLACCPASIFRHTGLLHENVYAHLHSSV